MAVSEGEIQQQLGEIPFFSRFFTGREVKHLHKVIRKGERILGLITGFHEEATWLMVVTDQRLLFIDKGLLVKLRVMDMPLTEIQSITFQTGFVFGTVTIQTGGGTKTVSKLWKGGTQRIADILSKAVAKSH